jgi:hypothetical protein
LKQQWGSTLVEPKYGWVGRLSARSYRLGYSMIDLGLLQASASHLVERV